MIEEKAPCVARGGLSEEGAFARDVSNKEGPIVQIKKGRKVQGNRMCKGPEVGPSFWVQ